MHPAQIDRVAPRDVLAHQLAGRGQAVDAGQRALLIKDHVVVREQRADDVGQLFHGNKGVSVVQIENQRVQHARVRALIREHGQAELHRQPVRELEVHIVVRVAEQIGVFAQRVDRALMQALIQQRRERDRQAVFAEEVHQQAHFALFDELAADLARLFLCDAADGGQALGLR